LPRIGERWGGFADSSVEVPGQVLKALNEEAWLDVAIHAVSHTQRAGQFVTFLGNLKQTRGKPPLYFEHALLPHSPWRFLPSGDAYPDADSVLGIEEDWSRWRPDAGLVDTALQRHLLQVGYTDRLLGVMLRRLAATGMYNRALVIVTADHGASFQPKGYMRNVVKANLSDIAGVPLFIKYPHQRRGRVDRRVARTTDLVPTIADVLGVRIPWHVDGVSLRGAPVSRLVSVSKLDGDPVAGDPRAVEAGVLRTARRNAGLFGQGHDSMNRVGPFTELIGRSIESLRWARSTRSRVSIANGALFDDVRPSSGFVPVRIAGVVSGDVARQGEPLAVVVDGRICTTTRSYELDGRDAFEALIPETSFHDGGNAVEIYSVSRSHGAFRLLRLGGTTYQTDAPVTADAASAPGPEAPQRP
jgi:hypothetical protein